MAFNSLNDLYLEWKTTKHFPFPYLLLETQEPLNAELLDNIANEHYINEYTQFIPDMKVFTFVLKYNDDENFSELSRYIFELTEASLHYGVFKGIVAIDLSEWCGNENSEYFDAFLAYLYDHNDKIYYVFTINSENHSDINEMFGKISEYFRIMVANIDIYNQNFTLPYLEKYFDKKKYKISKNILLNLTSVIERLSENPHFQFGRIALICEDLIAFSRKQGKTKILEQHYFEFLETNEYINYLNNISNVNKKIGITYEPQKDNIISNLM